MDVSCEEKLGVLLLADDERRYTPIRKGRFLVLSAFICVYQRPMKSLLLKHNLPADDRIFHIRRQNLIFGNGKDVFREHRDIR
jgi:hypothetical protein